MDEEKEIEVLTIRIQQLCDEIKSLEDKATAEEVKFSKFKAGVYQLAYSTSCTAANLDALSESIYEGN